MPETCKAYYKCVAKKIKEILLFANEITCGILISIDIDVKELSLIAAQLNTAYGFVYNTRINMHTCSLIFMHLHLIDTTISS